MAIPTFVAGNVLTAAQLNTITAALPIVDAWTNYTPTLTQSATVTKTVTYARYMKVGRKVTVSMRLDVTGAGTASNAIVVGLPAFTPVPGTDYALGGSGALYDASASQFFPFVPVMGATSTTFRALPTFTSLGSPYHLGAAIFTAALASGDSISCTFEYEATT